MNEEETAVASEPTQLTLGEGEFALPALRLLPTEDELRTALRVKPLSPATASYVKSNQLVEARYSLALDAQRTLAYCLAQLHGWDHEQPYPLQRIPMVDLIGAFPAFSSSGSAYSKIESALNSLMDAEVYVRDLSNGNWDRKRWISRASRDGSDILVRVSEDIKPHVQNLVKHFTVLKLKHLVDLSTPAQYRFYEKFRSALYRSELVLMYDQLRQDLQIPDHEYKLVGHFKQGILVPAINGINKRTDLVVTLRDKPLKSGKKIIGWVVTIRLKSQDELPMPSESHPIVVRLIKKGFSLQESRNLVKNFDEQYLADKITWVELKAAAGSIRDARSFLRCAISGDWKPSATKEEKDLAEELRQHEARKEAEALRDYRIRIQEAQRDAPEAIRFEIATRLFKSLKKKGKDDFRLAFAMHLEKVDPRLAGEFVNGISDNPRINAHQRLFLPNYFNVPMPDLATIQKYVAESAGPRP